MSSTTRGEVALFLPIATAIAIATSAALPAQTGTGAPAGKPPRIPADTEVIKHAAGFEYSILQKGTGTTRPAVGDAAAIHFTEWLSDGTLIRTSRNDIAVQITIGDPAVPFALAFGPQLLTKGGQVKMTLPPERAYGKAGIAGKIPPHSTMIYEVELIDYVYRPKPAQFVPGDPELTKATKSGLKYQAMEIGEGAHPSPNDIVEFEYTVWDLDGKLIFGSFKIGKTDRAPIQMLSHPFLREMLPMMKPGGVWRVFVPAELTVKELVTETIWSVKLIDSKPPPAFPNGHDAATTTTRSGLQFERLAAGKGDRPRDRFICQLEWDFWKTDGTFVAGSVIGGPMPIMIGKSQHKFLNEIVQLMQVGEVMRVEVPQAETTPQMLVFDTVWRLKLLAMKEPLPLPTFQLPEPSELTATKSGLQFKVLARGDGQSPIPQRGSQVSIHYAGWFTDGKPFDSSYEKGTPAVFGIDGQPRSIDGLNEGLQLMKVGDTFLFVIPGSLAYGARGTSDGTIPPDTTLVFQVHLLAIGR